MLDKKIIDDIICVFEIDEHYLLYDIDNAFSYEERFNEIEEKYGFKYAIKYSEYVYKNLELNNYLEVLDFYFYAYADYKAYNSINLDYEETCKIFGKFCDDASSKLKCTINKEKRLFEYIDYYKNRLLDFRIKYK